MLLRCASPLFSSLWKSRLSTHSDSLHNRAAGVRGRCGGVDLRTGGSSDKQSWRCIRGRSSPSRTRAGGDDPMRVTRVGQQPGS
jgi:hypothetical protein